jgi:hypothetical protein
MESNQKLNRILDAVGWGALFIWWGLSLIPHFLPNGLDAAGTGVILLGVSAVKRGKGFPVNGFAIALGVVTLAWGLLDLPRSVFHFSYQVPVFAILMIVLGVTVCALQLVKERKAI